MSFLESLPEELKADILQITNSNKEALPVFERLYNHLTSDGADLKRRKIDDGSQNNAHTIDSIAPDSIIFQLRDVSFQAPIRKKLSLTISISPINEKPLLSIAKSIDVKPDLIVADITNTNIQFATLLPVPEKKNQLYLVIFYTANSTSDTNNEPIVTVLNIDQVTKQLVADDKVMKPQDDLRVFLQRQFQISGFKLTDPFATFSDLNNPSFVSAHRGTKEGLLYFLPQHILFGFKKPISLFPIREIQGITYTSITRITFNITLKLKSGEKVEFSMIDQQDFPEIDQYVKNMRVQDMSMSDELKAKTVSKSADQESLGALAEAEAEADANIRVGDAALAEQRQEQGEGETEGQEEEDSDDEEEDGNFEVHGEIDDTSDVSSEEEGVSDAEAQNAEEDDDEDDDEEEEQDEQEITDLNSDDD
ncbi:hypothetical protein WICPIJ_005694 [Wickerhamomyces pijperi]|uniref:Histone chaperone RTT106 n=1 Tax=Wickerhamomyces pijperi TaxID=599730 RepID=A0A9P8Q589_WICPI|nr:hypothetical protein WICPIJ_005694 [Wickerhamomyces pijperi]